MHRLDERAVGMYDIFTARPDNTPYEPILDEVPRTIYEGPENALTQRSARMDWSEIDQNPDAGDFYWQYRPTLIHLFHMALYQQIFLPCSSYLPRTYSLFTFPLIICAMHNINRKTVFISINPNI